ncbi:MAG: hypothetical protein QNL04_13900, partial [SAR324 cluster bacterium]|nr:hypothetical protein [SAR324 cluster bacterium]
PLDTAIKVESIDQLNSMLTKRKWEPEKLIGMFTNDVTMLRFSANKQSENILTDIKQKNETEGMGNYKIKGTKIELINFSHCPNCQKIFSYKDLQQYYLYPKVIQGIHKNTIFRKDTRVNCPDCQTWFLPALIISDGSPKNQTQFLCRTQTLDAIEEYFLESQKLVLGRDKKNKIVSSNGLRSIRNDLDYKKLQLKPTLLVNFIQYTPWDLTLDFLASENLTKEQPVFGAWYPK